MTVLSLSVVLAMNLLLGASPVSGFSSVSPPPSSITTTTATRRLSLYTSASSTSAEFELPEDLPNRNNNKDSSSSASFAMSDARRQRLQLEADAQQRFLQGEELQELRQQVLQLRDDLQNARMSFAHKRVKELERAILQAQQVDAEYVYHVAQERLMEDDLDDDDERSMWEREAQMARSVLPQFNLEGLWVGKYSDEGGFELINVTYVGDTLIAHKLTTPPSQHANVPKGQVTFQVDLSTQPTDALDPIELGPGAAKQWGSKFLSRFAGQGQVAAQGHRNAQWIDGHLILVGEYFSFAWLGIGHQVFFGRPSADLTLQLLKQAQQRTEQDPVSQDRAFLTKCWEETELLEDELQLQTDDYDDDEIVDQHAYYKLQGCFE